MSLPVRVCDCQGAPRSLPDGAALRELRIRPGFRVTRGQPIGTLEWEEEGEQNKKRKEAKLRAPEAGKVEKVSAKAKDNVQLGTVLLTLSTRCTHPTLMKDMCAECGADLRQEAAAAQTSSSPAKAPSAARTKEEGRLGPGGDDGRGGGEGSRASVAMVHSIPELKVSEEEAKTLGMEDESRLRRHRKLVLLVDLDQTLIHTTNENIKRNQKDVYHYQLYGQNSPWYHTRVRPFAGEFLSAVSELYELHICTFGARLYAHTVSGFLDPKGEFFSHRILSRDECFDNRSKTANLSSLFPCGDHMVCIIDDRKDVWNFAPNLVHIKPYVFFKDTGDINDPAKFNSPPEMCKKPKEEGEKSKRESQEEKAKDVDKKRSNKPLVEKREAPLDMEILEEGEDKSDKDSDHEKDKESVQSEEEKQVSEDLELSDDDDDDNDSVNEAKNKGKEEDDDEDGSGSSLEDDLEEQEDTDDYLRHLQDILKTVHTAYYELYDQVVEEQEEPPKKPDGDGEDKAGKDEASFHKSRHLLPDLKTVIPYVRRKTLAGITLALSGVDPMNVPAEKSKARAVARSLGAVVVDGIQHGETTHLVAARLGTAKVNEAKKSSNIHVVTPDWLWCCAERWEKVDERLFPLTKSSKVTLKPPAHCTSSEIHAQHQLLPPPALLPPMAPGSAFLHRSISTSSDTLPETMNPMLAFSTEELKGMDDEVAGSSDDDNSEDDSEGSSTKEQAGEEGGGGSGGADLRGVIQGRIPQLEDSSDESLDAEEPKGWAKKSKRRKKGYEECNDSNEEDEDNNGAPDDDEDEDDDDEDESDLESMAQQLEKEVMEN